MLVIRKDYEATGAHFVEHDQPIELFPGAWLTGPVPRTFPEHNWSVKGKVKTPGGVVEDTIPEDQSLFINTPKGLILIAGCGHAGVVNILTFAEKEFPNTPVYAIVGGLHLFPATDQQVAWTSDKLKDFGLSYLVGAHCTGIESVYQIRQRLGLPRQSAVVGAVGATFVLGEGIHPGSLAQKWLFVVASIGQPLSETACSELSIRRFLFRTAYSDLSSRTKKAAGERTRDPTTTTAILSKICTTVRLPPDHQRPIWSPTLTSPNSPAATPRSPSKLSPHSIPPRPALSPA